MIITYKFVAYAGSSFKDEQGLSLNFESLKDNWFTLDGREGKIKHAGYTSVYEQGYVGGYDNYMFIFKDTLDSINLRGEEKFETHDSIKVDKTDIETLKPITESDLKVNGFDGTFSYMT